jgi:hypothetical protein
MHLSAEFTTNRYQAAPCLEIHDPIRTAVHPLFPKMIPIITDTDAHRCTVVKHYVSASYFDQNARQRYGIHMYNTNMRTCIVMNDWAM